MFSPQQMHGKWCLHIYGSVCTFCTFVDHFLSVCGDPQMCKYYLYVFVAVKIYFYKTYNICET